MPITVNGTTINSLNVGNTQVNKVLVRQNESSDYKAVYFAESHEENIRVSGIMTAFTSITAIIDSCDKDALLGILRGKNYEKE